MSPSVITGEFAGRYTVEREVGRGATSTVWLARDREHGRPVALKILREELATDIAAERFLREVRVTAQLHHPHIVPVLNSGTHEGRLFFVLPYLDGGTLRARLERDKQLPVAEVVAIGLTIASALASAHEKNVLHRDVKPENILFTAGQACLADFGIARAIVHASGESTTSTGLVRGTPAYMSPEQASGDRDYDGRSDLYSLACVLYEALAGVPAFVGATSQQIVAQRLLHEPRPVRVFRPSVSVELEAVLAKALATSPADRYQTVKEFLDALAAVPTTPTREHTALPIRKRWRGVGGLAVIVAGVSLGLMVSATARDATKGVAATIFRAIGIGGPVLDSSAIAVFADDLQTNDTTPIDLAELLRAKLSRWRELTLPALPRTASAPHGAVSANDARREARQLGTAAYVIIGTQRSGDSLIVSARLFNTQTGLRENETRLRIAPVRSTADTAMQLVADSVLFHGLSPRTPRREGAAATRSVAARRAFLLGQVALEDGNFARADSEFFDATNIDPDYAQALIWLANVRSWTNSADRPWTQLVHQAQRAAVQRERLTRSDSLLLDGLSVFSTGHPEQAASIFERIARENHDDFAAWFQFGNALKRDSIVVRDSKSPSGWRFRASYEQSVRAFEHAFQLRPSVLRGFAGRSLISLQTLMYTSSSRLRLGLALAPDTTTFLGVPTWDSDSLKFIPLPRDGISLALWPGAVSAAVQHQRERLESIARQWRAESPRSAAAGEAVAISLEMLGDASAIDTMRVAENLAADSVDRLRMVGTEVLLRVKFSLPDDTTGLRTARRIADSLLARHPPRERHESQLLGALAALTGRAELAASYAIQGGLSIRPGPAIAQSGAALIAFASLGGPADSVEILLDAVERAIAGLPEENREAIRAQFLMRGAILAFPERRIPSAIANHGATSRYTSLVVAASAGDTATVRNAIARIGLARKWSRSADVTVDGLFTEAAALSEVGQTAEAANWLDPTLRTLRLSSSDDLAQIARAGPLIRALALRADLANRMGERVTARLWSRAVAILWSDADTFLRPTVQRMTSLAR